MGRGRSTFSHKKGGVDKRGSCSKKAGGITYFHKHFQMSSFCLCVVYVLIYTISTCNFYLFHRKGLVFLNLIDTYATFASE